MKKISAILPCYNVSRWIDRCLESLVRQTIGTDDLEIICVDDCSTDDTVDKLMVWEERYPDLIAVIRLDRNSRQGQARNIGLQYATGEWIGFIDSDDWVELTYFERMLNAAEGKDYEVVRCFYERDFSTELTLWSAETSGNITEYIVNSPEERKPYIIHPPLGYGAWGKIVRKSFLMENELFFPANITYEDAVWGSLVHLYFTKGCYVRDKLYHYFVNEESTVLTKNSNHHLDGLTSQTGLWREYIRRGFMDIYRDELVIEHIFSAYLPALKAAVVRYEKPDYNYYLLLRELMLDRIADYRTNPYYLNGTISDYYKLLLSAIDNQLSKSEFYELAENIKKIGL